LLNSERGLEIMPKTIKEHIFLVIENIFRNTSN